MKILGIIGEVCAGKTTISKNLANSSKLFTMFNDGIKHLEGDYEIKKIYQNNQDVINKIGNLYPSCVVNNQIDTKILGEFFFASSKNQIMIEQITHPVLKTQILEFIDLCKEKNILLIFDIPVLLKLNLNHKCDYVAFFTAQHTERIERGILRMIAKHAMTKAEAKGRFLNIDKIAVKKYDFKNNIIIDTTNYTNNPEVTINLAVDKIINFLTSI